VSHELGQVVQVAADNPRLVVLLSQDHRGLPGLPVAVSLLQSGVHVKAFHSLDLDVDTLCADQVGISGLTTILLGSAGFQPEEPVQFLGGFPLPSLPFVA